MSSGIVIFLVVLLVGGGAAGYIAAKRKIERFSMQVFGTRSLSQGLEQQAELLSETPKSVSGMTRIFAPQIQRDFPDFDLGKFKNRAENMLVAALLAVHGENIAGLPEVSQELKTQVTKQIEGNRAAGIRENYLKIKVHQTEITNYKKHQGKCTIVFQSAVEHYHYKEKDGVVISGRKDLKEQTKYNIELMYIQDAAVAEIDNAVGTTCPHCGAPVTMLGVMRCEYCGSEVTPVNDRVWSLQKYYEVDYHHV